MNESLWHRDRVLRLLPDEVPLTASYSHLRAKLSGDLNKYFAKTFCERTSYLNVWQVYYRVYTLHLVALHLTFMLAFFGLSPPWLLTATVTHAFCKILRQVGDIVIGHPPRGADSLSFDAKDEEPDESCEASCATERMSLISNASKCVTAAPLAARAHPAHRRTSLSLPQAPPLGDPPRSAIRQHPILQAGGEQIDRAREHVDGEALELHARQTHVRLGAALARGQLQGADRALCPPLALLSGANGAHHRGRPPLRPLHARRLVGHIALFCR